MTDHFLWNIFPYFMFITIIACWGMMLGMFVWMFFDLQHKLKCVGRYLHNTWRRWRLESAIRWRRYKCDRDWHDYPDEKDPELRIPMHFYEYRCRHCAKRFYI